MEPCNENTRISILLEKQVEKNQEMTNKKLNSLDYLESILIIITNPLLPAEKI